MLLYNIENKPSLNEKQKYWQNVRLNFYRKYLSVEIKTGMAYTHTSY